MEVKFSYKIAGCIWQNGSAEYVTEEKILDNVSSETEGILKAKAFLFDEGQGNYTPELLELTVIEAEEKTRKII